MRAARDYTVLIDGYNLIKRHAPWRRLALPEARHRLIELLGRTRWPVPTPRVIVVFDGTAEESAVHRSASHVEVRFAAPSADALLQELIRTSSAPSRLLVMSDDREILNTAKSHGAVRYSAQWVFDRLDPASQRRHGVTADKPSLAAADARRITEELLARWLGPTRPS